MKNIYLILLLFCASIKAYAYDVTVAKDGSGNYMTVQAAVDAAPTGRTVAYTIFIKNGTYKEIINVPSNKPFLQFIGESVANVVLTYDNYSGKAIPGGGTYGTSTSASTTINAADFTAVNITFENTTGEQPQALAINVNNDRAAFKNCRFLGGQDTLLANGTTSGRRQYYKQCYIDGTVDFIFGSASAVFDDCTIYPKTRASSGASYITAANTPAGQTYGYVFRNCTINGNRGTTQYFLGRPWQNDAATTAKAENKVVFLNTVQANQSISPFSPVVQSAGWAVWDAGTNTALITFAEYQSVKTDATAVDVSARISWSQQLTATQAAAYTNANIFSTWDPCTTYADVCNSTPLDIAVANLKSVKGTSTSVFTWNASWGIDGVTYDLQRSTDNQASFSSIYSVTSSGIYDVNFTYTDANPPSPSTYFYRVVASKTGLAAHTTTATSVSSTPTITVGTLGNFLQSVGTPSVGQSYSLSAVNLLGDLTITPPTNYQISTDGGATYSSTPLSITPTSGAISVRNIFVRLNATTAGTYTGNVVNSSSGATDGNVAVTGTTQAAALPTYVTLAYFPMTTNNQDTAALRATGVTIGTPTFSRLVSADGVTSAGSGAFVLGPYQYNYGQAFAALATGSWTTANGGPGGNLSRTHYEQFTITANSGYSVRIDSFYMTAGVFFTNSNTKLAVVYSKTGFTTADSTDVAGGKDATGASLVSTANGAFLTPVLLPNSNGLNHGKYYFLLNSTAGVTLSAGQTLTIRAYFSCGSSGVGRDATVKDVYFKGLASPSLPLSITTFSGEKMSNTNNRLTWATASETNNAFFTIERSNNGADFKSIGQTKGAGTTKTPQYYSYFDNNPTPSVNYYRLKQTDFDGKTSLSKIISINNSLANKNSLKMTPSVISDNLTVEITAEDAGTLHITDAVGRVIFSKNGVIKGISTENISMNGLPSGVYFGVFINKNGQTTVRFVKQ